MALATFSFRLYVCYTRPRCPNAEKKFKIFVVLLTETWNDVLVWISYVYCLPLVRINLDSYMKIVRFVLNIIILEKIKEESPTFTNIIMYCFSIVFDKNALEERCLFHIFSIIYVDHLSKYKPKNWYSLL